MKSQHSLMRLTRQAIPTAAASLAAAFRDYPLLVHATSDERERTALALAFCSVALHYAVRWGEAYASSPACEGVAAWLPAECFPMTLGKSLRAIPLSVLLSLGRHGGSRLRTAGAYLDAMHRRLAPPGHLFLFVLGVAPQHQGAGHASALLRPVLARLDRDHRPCYVDTVNGDAVPLYEHLGFTVVERARIPGTELTAWALVREPASSAADT